MPRRSGEPDLEEGFQNPPNSAKPRVWWHWMNGNITKEGVKLDLELSGLGLAGFARTTVDRLATMAPTSGEARDALALLFRLARP